MIQGGLDRLKDENTSFTRSRPQLQQTDDSQRIHHGTYHETLRD